MIPAKPLLAITSTRTTLVRLPPLSSLLGSSSRQTASSYLTLQSSGFPGPARTRRITQRSTSSSVRPSLDYPYQDIRGDQGRVPRSLAGLHTMSIPHDVQIFLAGYPDQPDRPHLNANVEFYCNTRTCEPDGMKYETWMSKYENDVVELEMNHGYVQWLFPIREHGVNPRAQPLQLHEITFMSNDSQIMARLLRSYRMMCAFYGIEFNGGRLRRTADYKARFSNLQSRGHNLLRLTRILKHLSEFPFLQPHAAALVLFLAAQHSDGRLNLTPRGDGARGNGTMHGDSMDKWWVNCFRDEEERKQVKSLVLGRGRLGEGKWGEEEWGKWYDARTQGGKVGWAGEQEDSSEVDN